MSRGLGDVYKRQLLEGILAFLTFHFRYTRPIYTGYLDHTSNYSIYYPSVRDAFGLGSLHGSLLVFGCRAEGLLY